MSTNTTIDYESYIENKLKPHAFGRTMSELTANLPDDASSERLEDMLTRLENAGRVRTVGEKWQWADF